MQFTLNQLVEAVVVEDRRQPLLLALEPVLEVRHTRPRVRVREAAALDDAAVLGVVEVVSLLGFGDASLVPSPWGKPERVA